ncbi:hypothetical protein QYE76_010651 [Lolium multiflorum]|uniref:Stigma-specific Stig1 family protein n=1 Tax=Lolium multiflorum TaxID=4521 RepID=A0AAD8TXL6_LOLMU|nr:hypothetical protein QYE76_010651 [Lolium multiflorum]
MANAALLLIFTLLATASATTISAGPALQARRSRFLLVGGAVQPPLPTYDCSKKSAEACLVPGSAGPACCGGHCVDTVASAEHCGGCNKACKQGRTCCGGHCVDLLFDKKNCGSCSNRCNKKCNNGFCDYAE